GNAFYLEELIRDAAHTARRLSTRPPGALAESLPDTVIAFAQARLERLAPSLRKVLRAASIYGEWFVLDGLRELVAQDPAALSAELASLVECEAISEADDSVAEGTRRFSFRHVFLRAAAYATLTPEERALGHRLAAQWLERNGQDKEVIALHWLEGGELKRAATAFAEAAEVRLARAQSESAARCAVRSLLVCDTS